MKSQGKKLSNFFSSRVLVFVLFMYLLDLGSNLHITYKIKKNISIMILGQIDKCHTSGQVASLLTIECIIED